MEYIREHKKQSIIILICLSIFLLFSITFGKYIYNAIDSYILETKNFYLHSNVLSVNDKNHKINNWDGVNSYSLTIDLNNRKNNLKSSDSDIKYNIFCTSTDDVTINLSKNNGVLYKNQGDDSYQIDIIPKRKFLAGEVICIRTFVESTYPYKYRISATFYISVTENNFTYEIIDNPNDNFFTLDLTNSLTFYNVEKAFGKYNVGDVIGLEEYNKLSLAEKRNCFSSVITLIFDPKIVYLDMTNSSYIHRINGSDKKKNINGNLYVSQYSFKVGATSNAKVTFYKADRSKDYTYPIVNDKSIINVKLKLAK